MKKYQETPTSAQSAGVASLHALGITWHRPGIREMGGIKLDDWGMVFGVFPPS